VILYLRFVDGSSRRIANVANVSLYTKSEAEHPPEMIVYFEDNAYRVEYLPLENVASVTTVAEPKTEAPKCPKCGENCGYWNKPLVCGK